MPTLPESGVKLIVETGDAESAVSDLMSQLDDLQGQSYTTEVNVETDSSALEDLPLDGETVDFTVNEQLEVSPANETSQEILGVLESINAKETFRMILDIAGTALDFLKAFESFAVEPMLDLEDAIAAVNAQTHNGVPDARELISDIFYSDLGDSIDQVGRLVVKAAQMKIPIREATTAALEFTHTFQDENPERVLETLNQMIIGKLAPNFTVAGDMLVRAFQTSANRGGDLLDTITNNATAIHDLGLTGPEAFSFIDTGMKAGFKSAQNVLDVLLKIKQNVTNAAGNASSDVSKTLKQLGIANPAETGEAWSADFFTAVIDKIKNMPGLSDTDKEALFTNLVGGKQGAKTFSSFLEISPDEAKTIFANVAGAAADAAMEADNSLRGAIDDFSLAVNKAVQEWLSSSAIDLPGKIAKLKTGLQGALNTLAEGGTLGEALTIALKPIGFDDEFQGLESALGNFIVALLQIVASIQDVTGHGAEAEGTRVLIAKMATTQLAFDLKIANPDEVALDIATATSRGLSSDQIAGSVSKVIADLINTGTKESLTQAQLLVDTLKKPVDQNKLPTLASGAPMNVEPVVTDEAITALQTKINTALEQAPPPDVVQQLSDQMGLLDTAVGGVHDKAMEAVNPLDKLTDSTRGFTYETNKITPKLGDASTAMYTVATSADTANISLTGMASALDLVVGKANQLDSAASHVADVQGQTEADPGKQLATGGNFTGTSLVGEQGREIVSSNKELSVLNNMTTEAILAAIQSFVPGHSFNKGGGGNSNTIVNNNNIPNIATADALGYRQAAQLRGMSGT